MVSFTICMQINRVYNEKPLINFLNEHSKKRDLVSYKYKDEDEKSQFSHKNTLNLTDDFGSRHRIFCELTNNFGMGLILLPSILWQLGGWCSAVYRKGVNPRDNLGGEPSSSYLALHHEEAKDIAITIKLPLAQSEKQTTRIQSPFLHSISRRISNKNSVISSPFASHESSRTIKTMSAPFLKKSAESAPNNALQPSTPPRGGFSSLEEEKKGSGKSIKEENISFKSKFSAPNSMRF